MTEKNRPPQHQGLREKPGEIIGESPGLTTTSTLAGTLKDETQKQIRRSAARTVRGDDVCSVNHEVPERGEHAFGGGGLPHFVSTYGINTCVLLVAALLRQTTIPTVMFTATSVVSTTSFTRFTKC